MWNLSFCAWLISPHMMATRSSWFAYMFAKFGVYFQASRDRNTEFEILNCNVYVEHYEFSWTIEKNVLCGCSVGWKLPLSCQTVRFFMLFAALVCACISGLLSTVATAVLIVLDLCCRMCLASFLFSTCLWHCIKTKFLSSYNYVFKKNLLYFLVAHTSDHLHLMELLHARAYASSLGFSVFFSFLFVGYANLYVESRFGLSALSSIFEFICCITVCSRHCTH